MGSFTADMLEYKEQMNKGVINKAYKGLMEYILGLKATFEKKYSEEMTSGGMYFGYMDMTYFPLFPHSLKEHGLKIAVVFIHETCKFEVWLAGVNKQVQAKYWGIIKESGWNKYPLVEIKKGVDAIIEHTLVNTPDFGDLDGLTRKIESETHSFIKDVEGFLYAH